MHRLPRSLVCAACGVVLLALSTGCASRQTKFGRETTILGGAVSVSSKSYAPVSPTTIDLDTTKVAGRGNPSGTQTKILWGLITLHDY